MAWTEEMVEELKRLWDEGVTTGEIGRRLNISKNSIVGKVHRLGLSGRPSPIKKKTTTETPVSAPKTEKKTKAPKKAVEQTSKQPKTEKKSLPKEDIKITKIEKLSSPKKTQIKEAPATNPEAPKTEKALPALNNEEEYIKLAKSINISSASSPKKEHLDLVDLDNHTCRWPIGDPKDENFHFCGRKVRIGQTYCEEHSMIAYVKPGKK